MEALILPFGLEFPFTSMAEIPRKYKIETIIILLSLANQIKETIIIVISETKRKH